jgi:hypothetical protein
MAELGTDNGKVSDTYTGNQRPTPETDSTPENQETTLTSDSIRKSKKERNQHSTTDTRQRTRINYHQQIHPRQNQHPTTDKGKTNMRKLIHFDGNFQKSAIYSAFAIKFVKITFLFCFRTYKVLQVLSLVTILKKSTT